MLLQEVKKYNDFIFESISNIKCYDEKLDLNLFEFFYRTFNLSSFELFNDDFSNLKKFIMSVDHENGELPFFFHKYIDKNAIEYFNEINLLYNFCNSKNLKIKSKLSCLSKCVCECFDNSFISNIGNPEKTKIFTRFLKEEKRWLVRSTKLKQNVLKKSNLPFSSLEIEDIKSIYHNSPHSKNTLNNLLKKKEIFESISCVNIVQELDKAINRLQETIELEKYGFQRVSISKILFFLEKKINYSLATIVPIEKPDQLEGTDAQRFLHFCENFKLLGKKSPIFDHYAEIRLTNSNISVLIGEIDTKSYFICFNYGI